jgi:hypothetical protein
MSAHITSDARTSLRAPRIGRFASIVFIAATALAAFCAPCSAAAQTGQGSISGRVTDPKGAVVQGASVAIVNTETGVTNKTLTNKAGDYQVTNLNPGTYSVDIGFKGFTQTITQGVIVSAGSTVETNVSLKVGRADTSVTVESGDSLLTKDDTGVSTTIDHQIVENLPYVERSSLEAALLVPGVNGDVLQPGGIQSENPSIFTSNIAPGAAITVGGSPPGTTSLIIDGSDVTQASLARYGLNLSGHVVQEITVVVSNPSAKYGLTGAGIIVETSRAGTDKYHGGITWRHTDPFFNAYPLGTTAKNDLHENYYGFYLGGPIRIPKIYNGKDKTFFFVGVEPARVRSNLSFRGTFLTPAELKGQMHDALPLLNQTVLKSQGYAAALAAPRLGNISYQSNTTSTLPCVAGNTSTAGLFPCGANYTNNTQYRQITGPLSDCSDLSLADNPNVTVCPDDLGPQLAQNPFAQFILSNMPTPTNPGPYASFDSPDGASQSDLTNGSYQRGIKVQDNRYSVRIDHQFNNSNTVFARFTRVPITSGRYLAVSADNPIVPSVADSIDTHDAALGYTHIFSNSLVNSFRYSWMRVNQKRLPPPSSLTQDFAAKYGLTPATSGAGLPGLGNLNANGVSYVIQPGTSSAAIQVDQNFIVGDDITLSRGAHLFSFGADVRWIQSNQYSLGGATGGSYSFQSAQTAGTAGGGTALSTFVLGDISSFGNTPLLVPGYYRYHYWAGYFQDNWRASAKVTLNIGLRYEVETPRMEAHDNQAFVALIPGTLNGMATSTAFCFSNACGNPRTLWPTNYWGLEPRIGIAYAPTQRATIRASYAITRLPLSGLENTPDPNFNVQGTAVGGVSGGTVPNYVTNYVSNKVLGPLQSAYTQLNGARGPFAFSTGLAPVFVDQVKAVPALQTYSLTVQYQPFSKTLVQVTYQGLHGTHLYGPFVALNTPPINTVISAIQSKQNLAITQANTYGIRANNNAVGSAVLTESSFQLLEPYQNFYNQGLIDIYPRNGDLHYDGMYASVNQRYNRNLSFIVNYTWTKSLDDIPDAGLGFNQGSGVTSPQNPFDQRSEYSVSTTDQPSKLRLGYNYSLPFGINQRFHTGNGLIDRLIGNISTAGTMQSSSGFPNYVQMGTAGNFYSVLPKGLNGCTTSGTNVDCITAALPSGYTLRPNFVPGQPLINPNWKKNPFVSAAGITSYLNPNAFTTPGSLNNPQLGNVPRTLADARSPREFICDMRVLKGFTIKSHYVLNVNATLSNVFNHPVYFGVQHALYSGVTVNSTNATLNGVPSGMVGQNASAVFGNLLASQTQGLSRVIRFGAEFNF